jgi:SSS family solute:Na+ symporter
MARVFSIVFTVAGVALVPVYMGFRSIYVAHGAFTAAISPPIIVVVVLGIAWPRFSGRAAFLTLLLGGALMGLSLRYPQLISPLADLHGMDPGTGYEYMRALFGFVLCAALAVVFSLVWPQRDREAIRGLWIGTIADAKRHFKGGEPNDDVPGEKVRVTLVAGPRRERGEAELPVVTLSRAVAARLAVRAGDIVYVCDTRWWLGGLVSLHGRAAVDDVDGERVVVPENEITAERLRVGERVVVERIV